MAEAQHTPGPWGCRPPHPHANADYLVMGHNDQLVAIVADYASPGEVRANAHILAAALQMREALKDFIQPYARLTTKQLNAFSERPTYGRVSPHLAASILSCREALAKAEAEGFAHG